MTHSSVLFVARANFAGLFFHRVSSFELKMSEEINRRVESDRSDLFDYCDSTSSVEDILAFAHALDETYAEKKKRVHWTTSIQKAAREGQIFHDREL